MLFPLEYLEFHIPLSPEIQLHGRRTREKGPPLLLLHGYPHTHALWHAVAPGLADSFTLVMPDLRGYGQSSKPACTADHGNYAKSAMAGDMVALMAQLGYESFYVCAHDRGARVTHSMAVRYPAAVRKAILLDISPTLKMFENMDMRLGVYYYHWLFLAQPAPFPEDMINAAPDRFLEYAVIGREPGVKMDPEAYEAYRDAMRDPEHVRGSCEDYRAAASVDLVEQREEREKGWKIKCPVRVLWGKAGVIEKLFDCVKDWQEVCEQEVTGEATDCGHDIPGNRPEDIIRHVKEFFKE